MLLGLGAPAAMLGSGPLGENPGDLVPSNSKSPARLINGIDIPFWGDPTTGKQCPVPVGGRPTPNCVQWNGKAGTQSGVSCDPAIDGRSGCNPPAAQYIPTQAQYEQQSAIVESGTGFFGGVKLWFVSPSAALAVIPEIVNLPEGLAAIAVIPAWLGVMSVPVALAGATYYFYKHKK